MQQKTLTAGLPSGLRQTKREEKALIAREQEFFLGVCFEANAHVGRLSWYSYVLSEQNLGLATESKTNALHLGRSDIVGVDNQDLGELLGQTVKTLQVASLLLKGGGSWHFGVTSKKVLRFRQPKLNN